MDALVPFHSTYIIYIIQFSNFRPCFFCHCDICGLSLWGSCGGITNDPCWRLKIFCLTHTEYRPFTVVTEVVLTIIFVTVFYVTYSSYVSTYKS